MVRHATPAPFHSSSMNAAVRQAAPSTRVTERARAVVARAQKQTIIVCTNSSCRRKGGAAALKLFYDMSPEDKIEIVEQDCLDECPMGPNCGIDGEIVKVINRVKTKNDVAAVLRSVGVEPVEE